jgi:dihydrofolate synthase/folylpolyglutamate synthase
VTERHELDQILAELYARQPEQHIRPRLEPTARLVGLMGDPQKNYGIIHITGTNGKTSTSRIIERILREHGLRTGRLTSPHLVNFNERIALDGDPVSDEILVDTYRENKPLMDLVDQQLISEGHQPLTFFEAFTAIAFQLFSDAPVDVLVLEVGMGGEWDSTNVADGVVAVFTPIALDHTERLGKDLDTIARTKSGIIKPAAMVVSAPQEPEVEAVLREAAGLTESIIHVLGTGGTSVVSEVAVGGQLASIIGLAGTYDDLFVGLLGDHQAVNAAVALMAVECFLGGANRSIDPELLAEAFATVTSPGRLQRVASNPAVIVDAAHNPHGARSLAEGVTSYFDFDDITLVFGSLSDKNYLEFLSTLAPFVQRIILTTPPSDRAIDAADIAAALMLPPDILVTVQPDPVVALVEARAYAAQSAKGAVVVSGSISLVGLTIVCASEEKWS